MTKLGALVWIVGIVAVAAAFIFMLSLLSGPSCSFSGGATGTCVMPS